MKSSALAWGAFFALALGIGAIWIERSSDSLPGTEATSPGETHASYEVVRVLDGDSLILRDQGDSEIEVRIHGIDAPERGEPFSSAARNQLRELLRDGEITLIERDRDRYGRTVAKLSVGGVDVGLEQIRSGMARYYRRYQSAQPLIDRALYEKAEASARSGRRGLWGDDDPSEP